MTLPLPGPVDDPKVQRALDEIAKQFPVQSAGATTVSVGTTTTGAAGTSASVNNSGSSTAAILDFTIPQGAKGDTGATGAKGDKGDTGATGATGATGSAGAAATVAVGTTTTGSAGTSASVSNSGTSSAATLNFTIPRGDTGAKGDKGDTGSTGATGATGSAATVAVGTTTTGSAGTSASVTNSGTSSAATFDFTIPRGDTGATGSTGPAGADGRTILSGSGAPSAGTGNNGDFYIDTASSTLYGPKTSGAWGSGTSLVGPSVSSPTGAMLQYAGSSAPSGYLLCDGGSYSTTTYAALYAVIGYTYGGSGGTFNLPDLRGRVPMGAGTGTGLTARTLAGTGGTETHTLSTAELPAHNHGLTNTLSVASHTHGATGLTFTGTAGTTGDESAHTHGPGTYETNFQSVTNTTVTGAAGRLTTGTGVTRAVSGTSGAGSAHNHSFTPNGSIGGSTASGTASLTGSLSVNNSGSGDAHNNLQPYLVLNYIIKT